MVSGFPLCSLTKGRRREEGGGRREEGGGEHILDESRGETRDPQQHEDSNKEATLASRDGSDDGCHLVGEPVDETELREGFHQDEEGGKEEERA
jgi:hypothetical protein